MESSKVYLQLKAMIEKYWLVPNPTEFEHQLQQLKEEGKISAEEYHSLMRLYIETLKRLD